MDERFEKLKKIAKEEFGVTISRSVKRLHFRDVFGRAIIIDENVAKSIGKEACMEKLGLEFVKENRWNSVFACGTIDEGVFCFLGVGDSENVSREDYKLDLDNTSQWPYRASCVVSLEDGAVTWKEVVVPEK